MPHETDTLIVGAGPAGLAVGAALRRAGVPFVMLERGQRIGESWHRHYERLHLHTPKRHSALPFRPYPRTYPTYPSRQQFVAYLDDYARAFDLRPKLGREVRSCARGADGGWEVATDDGDYRARHVVVATGFNRVPNVPRFAGQESFPGPVVHSSEYTSGAAFRGKRVLVVGFGNSGAEIALDLAEHGVACAVAVRGRVNVIPRDLLGIPIVVFGILLRPLPPQVADAMNRLTLRLAVGSLAALGLEKRADGPFTEIAVGQQIPMIDVGTLARIRSGDIAVRKGIVAFEGDTVRFADGVRERFDAVVLATGFTTGLASLLGEHGAVLDAEGRPRVHGGRPAMPGLYFCGFHIPRTGLLRQIAAEACDIGRDIAGSGRGTRDVVPLGAPPA